MNENGTFYLTYLVPLSNKYIVDIACTSKADNTALLPVWLCRTESQDCDIRFWNAIAATLSSVLCILSFFFQWYINQMDYKNIGTQIIFINVWLQT
jgi:hypothetical protein